MNMTISQILIYIFWIASIRSFFVNIHLAEIKFRKVTKWVTLTIFFGVFGTIMLLLANKEPNSEATHF